MELELEFLILSAFLISLSWRRLANIFKRHHYDDNNSKAFRTMAELETPPSIPLVGNYQLLKPGLDHLRVAEEWAKKYGPIFKITLFGERFVYLNDPSMLQKILSSNNPKHLNKYRRAYDSVFSGRMMDGLVGADYNVWNPHRRILSRSFNFQSLQNNLILMNKHAKELISCFLSLQTKTGDKIPKLEGLEIKDILHNRTLKLILHTIIELEPNEEQEMENFIESIRTLKEIACKRLVKPWLLIDPIWRLHPLRKAQIRNILSSDRLLEVALAKFRNKAEAEASSKMLTVANKESTNESLANEDDVGAKPRKCLMEELIESGMTNKEILDEVITVLVAGHDSTANAITFLLFHLAKRADIQDKCREEIDHLFESKLGCGGDSSKDPLMVSDLTIDDLTRLKYLERCILEGLRICPVFPWVLRRLDAHLEIDDKLVLPEGVGVVIPPWTLHRNPEIFPSPESFDPDRFLPENCKMRHQYSHIPFLAGPRNCIAYKSAMMTIKVIVAFIIRYFKVETPQAREDLQVHFEINVKTKQKMNLILTRRF